MSTITADQDIDITADAATDDTVTPKRRGLVFWIVRYLPAR